MDRLSKAQARELADRLFKGGAYQRTDHSIEQGLDRNIDILDIGHCLENGEIFDDPTFNDPYKEWRYKIQGPDVDGHARSVVVSFENFEGEIVVIITVY